MKVTAAVLLVFAFTVLIVGASALPPFGDPGAPAARHVSPRYIEQGRNETGAANLVTAVLADYRGYDTLGETTVIFTAALACLLIVGAGAGWRSARGRE